MRAWKAVGLALFGACLFAAEPLIPRLGSTAIAADASMQSENSTPDAQSTTRAPRYITLAPLLVSVIRHNDVRKLVTLMITLELADAEKRVDVERLMPRLRDAYISDLQRLFSLGLYDNRTVDLVLVKKRLFALSRKVMGAGVVKDVLILNAMERAV